MADLNEAYKIAKKDELKKAIRNVLLYCRFDTAENLAESVKVLEEFLQEEENEK
jgi:vacuolar-type H+-ATPase subunit C/Vma6